MTLLILGPNSRSRGPTTRDGYSRLMLRQGNTANAIRGAYLGKTKMAQLYRPGGVLSYDSVFCGNPPPRGRNHTEDVLQYMLAPSLYSKKSFIFLKLTSSVLPFNFILMLDFGQTKKLGWTVAVPFAGSYEMTSKSFQPVPGCPDCQGRIYIL